MGSEGCATALGYTPEARLKVLQVIVQLMLRPPFTNQFTFSQDQARLKRDVGAATEALSAPGARSEYLDIVNRALRRDPESAPLAARLGNMELEAGDPARALPLMEKAESLQPRSVDLSMRKAETLMRLRRFDEAEALLLEAIKMDEVYFAPSRILVELWADTNQVDKGRAFFSRELGRRPTNSYLRLEYANLLARGGDQAGAEREARRIWDEDRDSRPAMAALELLVRLYGREGRSADADALSLGAFAHQPQDFFNNRRLVRIYAEKKDAVGVAESLQAVEASGPFDAAEHLDLAHRLSDLNRGPEMLDELAEARAVAEVEKNPGQLQSINAMIAAYRRRFSGGQAR
jgi:tetratricopeptide (TPR) repeat protein